MEIHIPAHAPAHLHGCPVHIGGTDAASRNADGDKISDACLWSEHGEAFRSEHQAAYGAAERGQG